VRQIGSPRTDVRKTRSNKMRRSPHQLRRQENDQQAASTGPKAGKDLDRPPTLIHRPKCWICDEVAGRPRRASTRSNDLGGIHLRCNPIGAEGCQLSSSFNGNETSLALVARGYSFCKCLPRNLVRYPRFRWHGFPTRSALCRADGSRHSGHRV